MVQSGEVLAPSTFQIPSDYEDNPGDYEIWSVRAPVKFDLAVMDGNTHHFNLEQKKKKGKGKSKSKGQDSSATTFELDGKMYSLSKAFTTETESYRILSAAQDDEDDEMELEDAAGKSMTPLPVKFSRHFNLVESTNATVVDTDLAPSNEHAPDLDMETLQMRIPYVPIDQKKGLKRRWNVMGADATFKGYNDAVKAAKSDTKKAIANDETPNASPSKSAEKRKKRKSEKKQKKPKK
mmetsp:Transcript_22255/g.32508  ORF Transcript_22255/g.32508 Transcript_22255/m.32508 type:complete len:237 (+) Transcript_22255:27-737(+)